MTLWKRRKNRKKGKSNKVVIKTARKSTRMTKETCKSLGGTWRNGSCMIPKVHQKKLYDNYADPVRILKNNRIVAQGRNLAVIDRYRRTSSGVKSVHQRGDLLIVNYDDGAVCRTRFADRTVLKDWIERKRRHGTFP